MLLFPLLAIKGQQNYKLQITNYNKEFWKKNRQKSYIYTSYYIIIYI